MNDASLQTAMGDRTDQSGVSDDEILGEGTYQLVPAELFSELSISEPSATHRTLSLTQFPTQQPRALPVEGLEASVVLAIMLRTQWSHDQSVRKESSHIPPSPIGVEMSTRMWRFLHGLPILGRDDEPFDMLKEIPEIGVHTMLNEFLLDATRDQFFEVFGYVAPYETDVETSYAQQICHLQQQAAEAWDDGGYGGDVPTLVHVVVLDHESIIWSGPVIPELRQVEWEYRMLDQINFSKDHA